MFMYMSVCRFRGKYCTTIIIKLNFHLALSAIDSLHKSNWKLIALKMVQVLWAVNKAGVNNPSHRPFSSLWYTLYQAFYCIRCEEKNVRFMQPTQGDKSDGGEIIL